MPYGPFGSTVKAIRMVLADGTLIKCSRSENAELVSLAIGGYGLFGIIVELDVEMVPNLLLEPKFEGMVPEEFAEGSARIIKSDKPVVMAYGRMPLWRRNFFDDALMITYRPSVDQPAPLPAVASSGKLTGLINEIYRAQTGWEVTKGLRWFIGSTAWPRHHRRLRHAQLADGRAGRHPRAEGRAADRHPANISSRPSDSANS